MDGEAFEDRSEADAPLSEKAYRRIEELIVTEQLPPGHVLSEASLSERLEIGRTPVREALQRLAAEGLVIVLPRRGVMVSEFGVEDCLLLLEVRRAVETLVVRNAARRSEDHERAAFADCAAAFSKILSSADDDAFARVDMRFNLLLFSACKNPYAARSLQSMSGLFRRFSFQKMRSERNRAESVRRHQRLAAAIADGDADAAQAACAELLDHIEQTARAALD